MISSSELLQMFSFGFCAFKEKRETLGRVFFEWSNSILRPIGSSIVSTQLRGHPADLIPRLFPLVSPVATRDLFLDFGNQWVVTLDNSHLGTDANLAPVLSRKCGCLAIRVVSHPHTFDRVTGHGRYGAEIFESYLAGESQRTVFCANDVGRWKFGESGTPYPVENVLKYAARVKRDRFTHGDIVAVLSHLGVNVFEADWTARGATTGATLFERVGKMPLDYREYAIGDDE